MSKVYVVNMNLDNCEHYCEDIEHATYTIGVFTTKEKAESFIASDEVIEIAKESDIYEWHVSCGGRNKSIKIDRVRETAIHFHADYFSQMDAEFEIKEFELI